MTRGKPTPLPDPGVDLTNQVELLRSRMGSGLRIEFSTNPILDVEDILVASLIKDLTDLPEMRFDFVARAVMRRRFRLNG